MPKCQKRDIAESHQQNYLRIKDVAARYNCSRGHVTNLVEAGILPPPMTDNGLKQWPTVVFDALDKQRDQKYLKMLKDSGFNIPESQPK